jgi:predicted NUDIX family NTP pyrophosphohydrolase
MVSKSAGLLLHRREDGRLMVLLVHPGGPFWRNRDLGAWSIPKGEVRPGETLEGVARREFEEELGAAFDGPLTPLGSVRQKGGKLVHGFAGEGAFEPSGLRSNLFEMEWPPRSGRLESFPEVDRAEWFEAAVARSKILSAQAVFIDRLEKSLAGREAPDADLQSPPGDQPPTNRRSR